MMRVKRLVILVKSVEGARREVLLDDPGVGAAAEAEAGEPTH